MFKEFLKAIPLTTTLHHPPSVANSKICFLASLMLFCLKTIPTVFG